MNSFKFFHGFIVDAETELTMLLSEQITRTIDDDIVDRLTRTINDGNVLNLRDRVEYFERWLDIGGQRA